MPPEPSAPPTLDLDLGLELTVDPAAPARDLGPLAALLLRLAESAGREGRAGPENVDS